MKTEKPDWCCIQDKGTTKNKYYKNVLKLKVPAEKSNGAEKKYTIVRATQEVMTII